MRDPDPARSLAEKLRGLDLDDRELDVLERVLQRAEGEQVIDLDVEGFVYGLGLEPDTVFDPSRLAGAARADGRTDARPQAGGSR